MKTCIPQNIMRKLKKALYTCYHISLISLAILSVAITACLANHFFPLDLSRYHDLSHTVLDTEGNLLTVLLAKDQRWRLPVRLTDVDPLLLNTLIAYEDKRFFYHPGIDPFAFARAAWQYIKAGRVLSGGSTLTLQTVRLLEPRPRTILSKLKECLRAIQLEYHFSKREILEIYLTLAPYGGNLEGVRAATLAYFGKEPQRLTIAQAALLAALPQRPERARPDRCSKQARLHRDKVICKMQEMGLLNNHQATEAKQDRIPGFKCRFPRTALHLAYKLRSEQIGSIHTTFIDRILQHQIEALLSNQLQFLEPSQTMAALVVDNKTRRIIAYVGSGDFYSEERCGQLDMITAIRSPGSTLKPFIYAMGFDDKIIHPDTMIEDVPTLFKDYAPSNFKDSFHGIISIREALQQSLNIPAVAILHKVGPGRFVHHLNSLGVTLQLQQSNQPSLPIALGGVGTRLLDLVALYSALANKGEFSALLLSFNSKEIPSKQQRLTSVISARHIQQILKETPLPPGLVDWRVTHHSPVAYKTGTSYGFRDAWAIGFTQGFTVGVWAGKADGTPSINQTGRTHAAPILFKIFGFLPNQPQLASPSLPTVVCHALASFKNLNGSESHKSSELRILFPHPNSVIRLEKQASGWRSVPVRIAGGSPPFYCLENGHLICSFGGREWRWHPTSIGFTDLTFLDSAGKSASITIQLQGD